MSMVTIRRVDFPLKDGRMRRAAREREIRSRKLLKKRLQIANGVRTDSNLAQHYATQRICGSFRGTGFGVTLG